MAAWTLEEAKAKLKMWMDADEALAVTGQAYVVDVGGSKRSLTRADAAEIQNRIRYWAREVSRLESGSRGLRVRRVIPRDV